MSMSYSERAQLGGLALHAKVSSVEHLAPARAGFLRRFEDEVDPDRVLPEAERLKRAERARRVYMKKLAYRSRDARRVRAQAKKASRPTTANARTP